MISKQAIAEVELSESFKEYKFGIKESGLAHILGILRSKLYSNKILACIREYSCNAFDANVEAGNGKRPIEVTLPNSFQSEFRVRDFGHGLSEEQIEEVFCNYGESTKRHSNKYVGMLGIGCKSAFAYGDNFLILSYQDGKCITYNAYIDPSRIGRIACMSEADCNEPNGLEIVIPVSDGDRGRFFSEAEQFFRFWKLPPVIKGVNPLPNLKKEEPRLRGKDWAIIGGFSCHAIMGNIAYKIDTGLLLSHCSSTTEKNLINAGIELEFPIGNLEIAASRESLEYTDLTIKNFKTRLSRVAVEIALMIQKDLEKCKSIIEAKTLLHKLPSFCKGAPLIWNNIELSDSRIKYPSTEASLAQYVYHSKGIKAYIVEYFECNETLNIFYQDISTHLKSRARTLMNSPGKNIIFLSFKDAAQKSKFEQETHIIVDDLPKLSSVAVTKKPASQRKVYGEAYLLKEMRFNSSQARHPSRAWELEKIDPNGIGVYVKLDRFFPIFATPKWSRLSMYRFQDVLSNFGAFFDLTSLNIYGLRKEIKLGKGWVLLEHFIEEKVKEFLQKSNYKEILVDFSTKYPAIEDRKKEIKSPDSLMLKYFVETKKLQEIKKKNEKVVAALHFLRSFIDFKFEGNAQDDISKLNSLEQEVAEKYPVAIFDDCRWASDKKIDALINYINFIDSLEIKSKK